MHFSYRLSSVSSAAVFAAVLGVVGVTAPVSAGTAPLVVKLTAGDGAELDRFGYSVALDGGKALVGSYRDDANGSASGSAYVFDSATGNQLVKLVASDGAPNDRTGFAVALDAGTALVGSYRDDGVAAGSAYLFDAATGTQSAKLTPADSAPGDQFGISVALDNGTALVGGFRFDGTNAGSAYLFDAATGSQLGTLSAPDGVAGNAFGVSVALDGNLALVGSSRNGGAAYLFDITTGAFLTKLTAFDGEPNDFFGFSVALDDGLAIVGAWGADGVVADAGAAYVFDVSAFVPEPASATLLLAPAWALGRRRQA